MRPSFVIVMAALMLLGMPAAMVIAAAGEAADCLALSGQPRRLVRVATSTAAALVAIQFAGAVHLILGGTIGHFVWPWQALPIAAAVIAYCVGRGTTAKVVAPLVMRRPIDPEWAPYILASCAPHAVGAALAVALAEAIAHGQWVLLPVVAVPLYLTYRAYDSYLNRHHEDHRRREVADALVQGMVVVNSSGSVTVWSEEMTRLVGCPPERALGQSLTVAVPALGRTHLPQIVDEVLIHRDPRTVARVVLPFAATPAHPRGARDARGWGRHPHLARPHRALARGRRRASKRGAPGAGRRSRQRRPVGMGSAAAGVLLLRPLAGNGRPAGAVGPGPPGGVAVACPPG